MICTMPVSTFAFGVDAATMCTPGIFSTSAFSPSRASMGSSSSTMSTVMISGPLNPMPNVLVISSKVSRSCVPGSE